MKFLKALLLLCLLPSLAWADGSATLANYLGNTTIFPGVIAGGAAVISNNTTDAADSASLCLSGGGACSTARGAVALLYGNEQGTPGGIQIRTGAVANSIAYVDLQDSGSTIQLRNSSNGTMWTFDTTGLITQNATNGNNLVFTKNGTGVFATGATDMLIQGSASAGAGVTLNAPSTGSAITFKTTNGTIWQMNAAGDLVGNSSNQGNLTFNRSLKGIGTNTATLAAAGTTQSDAAAIVSISTRVTGANATVGVKLPAISSVAVGSHLLIINSNTTFALKLYSNAAGETIYGSSGTSAVNLIGKAAADCFVYDSTNWYCNILTAPF